jgi:hypothetical protein
MRTGAGDAAVAGGAVVATAADAVAVTDAVSVLTATVAAALGATSVSNVAVVPTDTPGNPPSASAAGAKAKHPIANTIKTTCPVRRRRRSRGDPFPTGFS